MFPTFKQAKETGGVNPIKEPKTEFFFFCARRFHHLLEYLCCNLATVANACL